MRTCKGCGGVRAPRDVPENRRVRVSGAGRRDQQARVVPRMNRAGARERLREMGLDPVMVARSIAAGRKTDRPQQQTQ
ncbi:MAG: hypothetical protein RLZZ253_1708 [Verrucomicrobiota bacterium]